MDNQVIHYNCAYEQTCGFDCASGALNFKSNYFWPVSYSTGKDAYVQKSEYYWNPRMIISSNAFYGAKANANQRLFISPSSKLPRDLVRNSGYKIVLDKANADFIVIPSTRNMSVAEHKFNVAFKTDNDNLYLVSVNKSDETDRFSRDEVDAIVDTIAGRFKKNISEWYYYDDMSGFGVFFMPKCKEYEDMYIEYYNGGIKNHYVMDCNVELVGSSSISVETLEIWSRMRDRSVFEKAILNSDWQKYPCTVAVFLSEEQSSFCNFPSGQWKWLLNQIDYNMYEKSGTFGDKVITPEDWNMLQKWISYKFGIPEKGGYISVESFDNISDRYRDLLRSRVCCVPIIANHEMTFKNRLAMVRNLS